MKTISILLISIQLLARYQVTAQYRNSLNARISNMTKETKPEKNVKAMSVLIKKFRLDTVKDAENIDVIKGITALTFLHVNNFSQFENYINQIKNKFNQTSYLNMAANELISNKKSLVYAELIAQRTIDLYLSFKDDPSARPADFPLQDWNRFMSMAQYPYYLSYAQILHMNGKNAMALSYIERAFSYLPMDSADQASAELYAVLLEANGQADKSYDILLRSASTGNASLPMQQQLTRLLATRTGNADQASRFMDSLQQNIVSAYKAALMSKLLTDITAPPFSLTDTRENRVYLTQRKGKVVVLDFWATWCAPCKAAMPAMERLKKKHPEVDWYYIATMEKGAAASSRIKQYLKKHAQPANTLIDIPIPDDSGMFETAAAYNVKAIPFRAIIDKNGMLRFISEGYTSDAALINEMEAMIDIAKQQ